MSDPDWSAPSSATIPLSGGGQADGSRTAFAHVEAARVRGSEPSAAFAPTGASAARDFLAERLALFVASRAWLPPGSSSCAWS
jgi:hypothetical protein